ncbi:MAG TPA: hypothetical protein VG123_11585, partial [Streptosporangiaceae bacterium]|nr:hypothetical protein [Streptosporangiaceae bacterium]
YVLSNLIKPRYASVDGSSPGFSTYPTTLVHTVHEIPGSGGSYTGITPLWASIPSPSGNTYYAAVNKALGATLTMQPSNGNTAVAVDRCEPGDDRPRRWRELAGRLPPYQVNQDRALAEWAWPPGGPPLPDNYDHRHVSHLYPVWPLHEITPGGHPEPAAAAVRALRLRSAENGSAHSWLHQALAAGQPAQIALDWTPAPQPATS